MAPAFVAYARSLLNLASITSTGLEHRNPDETHDTMSRLGPFATRSLLARDDAPNRPNPEAGIIHPEDFNNKFIFVLFGLLGAALIIVGIWFFFWAKNGGFYFKETDWEDYKSSVLRRKGPNGTTLTGATTSTNLGGGSVYKDVDDGSNEDATTVSATTGITGGVSDFVGREKRRKRRERKERDKERRREEKRREKEELKRSKERNRRRKVAEEGGVVDEEAEAEAEKHLRSYRHEQPARVGGINKKSDASQWDGSTNPTDTSRGGNTDTSVTSTLMGGQERLLTDSPDKTKKSSGIRKVYSTADKRETRETERMLAEAKRLQERGRAAAAAVASGGGASSSHRRTFSWQQNNTVDEDTPMAPSRYGPNDEVDSRIPGGWAEGDVGGDLGTKSYHCVIPGLSDSGAGSGAGGSDVRDYAEEKRKQRGGAGHRRER